MRNAVAALLTFAIFLPAANAEAKTSLLGKWELVRVSRGAQSKKVTDRYLSLEFKKGGAFVTVMRHRGKSISHNGRWTVEGNTLTTKTPKHTEVVTFKFSGAELQLTRPKAHVSMHLRRAK